MLLARHRVRRIALVVAGGVLAVLVVAQLALPVIAARIARDRIARYGTVRSVSVSAWPAIQLLWGSAQSAHVRAGALSMSQSQADGLLPQMAGIERLRLSAESLQIGPFRLHDAELEKHGSDVTVEGVLEQSDLQAALPAGVQARPLASGRGAVEMLLSGSLLGVGVSVHAVVAAGEGKLVAEPQGLPFAGLARVTIFSDPRLAVRDFALTILAPAAGQARYRVQLAARLR
ncbi:MAG TPA: LmeA family phospholipid-binding protein [Solirubrobacteraceae bacterium]|nr:LmeA family phospholipid-binding protein [Solirubrobacteraceae bacterium]